MLPSALPFCTAFELFHVILQQKKQRGCLKKIFQNQLRQSLFLGEIGIQPVEKRKNSAPNLRGRPFASQKVR
ncbi:MAG: hypothetical protein U0O40_13060, partial [Phocaeicola dorei]